MISKEEAVEAGISERLYNKATEQGMTLRKVDGFRAVWDRPEDRKAREEAVRGPIEALVATIASTGHEDGISNAVDEIMDGLDAL